VLNLPKPPSLNKIYSGGHWAIRAKYKNDYKREIKKELDLFDKFTCESYSLDIRYNSRLDIDNGILVSKFLSDCLVEEGYVEDDSPKYFTSVRIRFDSSLPKNIYQVVIKIKGYKV
jgi:hypothetical protein